MKELLIIPGIIILMAVLHNHQMIRELRDDNVGLLKEYKLVIEKNQILEWQNDSLASGQLDLCEYYKMQFNDHKIHQNCNN